MAKQKQPVYEEERQGTSVLTKVILAIAFFGIAAFMLYINLAAPQTGTAMGAVRDVMRGIGGIVSILLSGIFIWLGGLQVLSIAGKPVKIWRAILHVLLFVGLFTAVHLFSAEKIIRTLMSIPGYPNFINMSYQYGAGGGVIGALAAYPLYIFGGAWGGLLIVILLAVIFCTALGYTQKLVSWSMIRAEEGHHRAEQKRNIKNVERMFDYDEFDEYDNPRAARPAPRREPVRAETMRSEPVRRENRRVETPERRPRTARPDHIVSPSVTEEKPAELKRPPKGPSKRRLYQETVEPELNEVKSTEDELEIPKSLRKIRTERTERPKDGSSVFHSKPVKKEEPVAEDIPDEIPDEIFDVQVEDTSFKPEKYDAPKPRKKLVVEGVRPLGVSDDEDLTIVPDKYEDDDDDEPPFDMPEPMPKKAKKAAENTEKFVADVQDDDDEGYNYPPIDLLAQGDAVKNTQASKDKDREKAEKLIDTLRSFGIETRLIGIAHGPAVTRFELQPAAGVKVSRITSLSDDIALNLAAMSVRIEAPIPGKSALGVEIPNDKVEMVRLRDVLESGDARRHPSKIAVGLGKDNSGRYIVGDIAKMPHVLIAGQTGSGKSVCINSIITSILYRAAPEEVRLILIDPKVVELSIYNDIPHLIAPVVTDPKKAASALDWAVAEMMRRYKCFAEKGVRDIKGFNKALNKDEKLMPQMVIIIDELADLMMVCPGEVEESICRLAQLARAAGIHLVIATQRPSVNVITGIIKANIPTRIAFSVTSSVDSRTVIDHGGAEKLLGNGDMLFVPAGISKPMRVQGAWVSDDEVHAIVSFIKARSETAYDEDVIEKIENSVRSDAEKEEIAEEYDSRLPEAVEIVVEMGQASVSMLQRRMRVGYARAGRLIDEMERRGIVSEADGAKPRAVLISREQYKQMFEEGDFEEE